MTKMNKIVSTAFVLLNSIAIQAKNAPTTNRGGLYFVENKGQVKDQHDRQRKDVQYSVQAPGMNIFIGNGQIHYQFCKSRIDISAILASSRTLTPLPASQAKPQTESYRMDVALLNANKHIQVVAEEEQPYYENYYTPGVPAQGLQVHTYRKVTYKDVYPGIDWVIKTNGNKLEHEFVVGPGGDASKIKLQYSGQTSLSLNGDGSITAVTPMGIIKEQAPVCYLAGKGMKDGILPSSFRLQGNVLSYDLQGSGPLVIDPLVEWGTYYGPDSSSNEFYRIASDDSAHIYACGLTYGGNAGTISTTGSYQSTYNGNADAFLVKFDSSGNRIWATYYGGTGEDWGVAVTCDHAGGVYMAGNTTSSTDMTTAGCVQPVYGGGLWDGFIAKFTAGGFRLWGTYCGGSGANTPGSIVCDNFGNVYMGGVTGDANNIATAGSYQPAGGGNYDCFLEQYDVTTGLRNWGTYYGGAGAEAGGVICTDGNFIYITGSTTSTSGLATAGCHQIALAGATDDFVAKFNVSGGRVWGTYYGGSSSEDPAAVVCDNTGYIYLFGSTSSDTGIATTGAAQIARGGLTDAFLAKLEPELGNSVWGTYYGGPQAENTTDSRIAVDNLNNVYTTGYTSSTSGIASAGAWQPIYGGDPEDGFFAKYNGNGVQVWSTYYGGEGQDVGMSTGFDGLNVYIAGYTNSATNIATPGSYLDHGGGATFYTQSFLAKFYTPIDSLTLGAGGLQQSLNQVTIFPVPNNGSFTLSGTIGNYNGAIAISVTDATDKMILRKSVQVHNGILQEHIDAGSDLPTGIYFLKVVGDNNASRVLRFVKE